MAVSQPFAALPSQSPKPAPHDAILHAPATHDALALASVHGVPFCAGGFEHTPVVGAQVPAAWHTSLALHATGRQRQASPMPLPTLSF